MQITAAQKIIDNYSQWIAGSLTAVQQGSAVRIVTPMLDKNNDFMSIVLDESPGHGIIISDMGETVSELELSGMQIDTDARKSRLESILAGYGVQKTDNNEMFVRANESNINVKLNMFLQAMASVSDMFYINKNAVRSMFLDDVGNWLSDKELRPVQGPSFEGKSGLIYKFDYAIGANRGGKEKFIKTVNNPAESSVTNALFGWEDVEKSRRNSLGYLFLNTLNAKDGKIDNSILDACSNYGITPVQWGVNENDFIGELAA